MNKIVVSPLRGLFFNESSPSAPFKSLFPRYGGYSIYPVARIMEHYLHSMLTKGGVETEKVGKNKVVRNNFGYFDDKNKDGEYSVNSNKVKENLSINQCNLLNQIYNWYHNNRHEMFHWNKESGDTTMIPNMVEARNKIYEGEQLIERYYDIF